MVRSVLSSLSSTAISFSIKTTEFQRPTTRRLTGRVLEKCSWNLTFQLKRYSVFFRVFWIERAGCDDECVILVTATESPDDMKSMAVEAILLLQEKINDDDEETVKMQLLVPSRVIGCVIGRSGSVNASIRISKGNNDDLVEILIRGERHGKAAWEWFLQTDSMVMKVVSRQEIVVWYQSVHTHMEVCSAEWKFMNMSQQEEDLILRMYRLVGDRWETIAGRVPGRETGDRERFEDTHFFLPSSRSNAMVSLLSS
ncbi:uncharacterized protein LOC106415688 isoform X1 [Brassica napus]|uniref:uncharacterized protein LOC106415688 isoform X1 n=1 Tax=Brassica napus TaxID=3708 RepID=UPI0006AA948D|nr:uncharacterized protein LOC106415688 isoform X1 [Brassica napus]